MGFSSPEYILWFIAIPFALLFVMLIYRRTQRILYQWFDPYYYRNARPLLKNILRFSGVIFALLALLGPYWGKNDKGSRMLGKEIYILLDVSASMNSDDVRPTRLDKARKEIRALIDNLKGNHIGIIVFASNAYTQCPLTLDTKALHLFLDLASSSQFVQTGTNLRNALKLAQERFSQSEKHRDKMNRAAIIFTDGEDFGEGYVSILDGYKRNHIALFVVGVGTLQGAAVPEIEGGRIRGHKHRPDGSPITSILKETALREISEKAETPYFVLDNPSANLKLLVEELQSLSSSPSSEKMERVANSKYYVFSVLALICWGITLFLLPTQNVYRPE